MRRRIEHELKVLRSHYYDPRYVVTETEGEDESVLLAVSDGDMTVRATCGPSFPFASPHFDVAMSNRDAIVRGFHGILCRDVVEEIAERCGDFVPAKDFFLRYYPDGVDRARHVSELIQDKWSPAVRIVDVVKRVYQARRNDVYRQFYPLHAHHVLSLPH